MTRGTPGGKEQILHSSFVGSILFPLNGTMRIFDVGIQNHDLEGEINFRKRDVKFG